MARRSIDDGEKMKSENIEKQWRAAQLFVAKGPSATLEYMVDEARARLFAYGAQGLEGPCPPGHDRTLAVDPALRRKQEAWTSLGNMSKEEAKKMFVELLSSLLPEWKEWDNLHGEAVRTAQLDGGEAERLLRKFHNQTAPQLRSRL